VRGALVWCGLPDPFLTQQRAQRDMNEPENEAHDFWIGIIEASDGSTEQIVQLANERNAAKVLGAREQLTAFYLRSFLGRFVDRPRGGKRIRRDQTSFYVEEVNSAS
jgi:hypothetical protein